MAVTVQEANLGDTQSLPQTLEEVRRQLGALSEASTQASRTVKEVVLDGGYHSNETITTLRNLQLRSLCSGTQPRPTVVERQETVQVSSEYNRPFD